METAVALLMFCACCYCTCRTRFVQFTRLPQALRGACNVRASARGVSPFSAMATSLAATIGTGNIAGVAGAVLLGGPGAIFWMWASALVGMAAKYADIYFGMRYRTPDCIGPMAYMSRGLPERMRPLAKAYAACCAVACLCMGNLVQINAMSEAARGALAAYGFPAAGALWPRLALGLAVAGVVACVQRGGAQGVGRVATLLVPGMSVLYLLCAGAVIVVCYRALPAAFAAIFAGALEPRAFLVGITRGTFTHEAGLGTAAIAHASADTDNAHRQALYGVFEVFFDTIVICSFTGLAVLVSGVSLIPGPEAKNSALIIEAFAPVFGARAAALGIAGSLALFAFSSILSFSYYGGVCASYVSGRTGERVYRYAFLLLMVLGAVMRVSLAWRLAEWANLAMAVINMTAIVTLLNGRGAPQRPKQKRRTRF